jgi:hypothetical protein
VTDDDPDALDADTGGDDLGDDLDLPATPLDAFADLGPWWAPPPGVDLGLTAHLDAGGQPRIVERRLVVTEDLAGSASTTTWCGSSPGCRAPGSRR